MISVMFTIIKVTAHGVRLHPWRSPLSLSFCLCLQGYHGRATFFRNRVSEVRGEWGTRSKKLPHPFVLPPKILPRVPLSFCIPGACGSRTLLPLLSRQTLRKLVRMTEGPCARTCYVLEQDRKNKLEFHRLHYWSSMTLSFLL